jgi:DNA-binding NarL/FixJ family response regulator
VNAPVYGALDRAPSGPGLTSGSVLPAPRSAGPDEDIALRTICVLIADPDHGTREPLAAGLSAVGVGSVLAAGSVDAVEDVARRQPTGDLALVSLLFGADAARLIAMLRAAGWTRVIALAPTADIGPVIDAVGAGVTGVLIGRRANPAAASLPSSIHDLSSREIEVIRLVADGRSNKWIGEQLTLSALTVKSHLARIGRKLGTGDRAHMVALAMRAGVIS